MASANLQFKIGSTFSGEGFKQAQQGCRDIKQAMTPAIGAANQMASALGGMDTSATKAFGAVTNLIGAFAQGGIQGAVMAAAMMALNGYIDSLKEKAKQATEAANALTAAVKAGFSAELSGQIKSILADVGQLRTNFENTAKQANAMADAILGLQQSQASGSVISLEIEKFQALIGEENEALKKDIQATYDLEIAKEKQKTVAEEWSTKLDIAHQKVEQAEGRVATINDQLATLASERADLEETLKDIAETSKEKRKEINQKMSELATKEEQLQGELQQAMEDKKLEIVKEQTAIQNAANANDKMKLAVEEAAQKITETGTKWGACDPATFVGAYQEEQDKEFQQKLKDLVKEMPNKLNDLKSANADVKGAVERFNNAQNAYNDNFVQNQVWNAIQNGVQMIGANVGGLNQNILKQQGNIAQAAGKLAGDAALAAGNVRTVADLKRVENEAAATARKDIASKITTQQTLEAARAARLEKMSDKAISASDRKWLQEYRRVKEANDAQTKALADAKQKVEDAKKRQEKMQEDLAKIADKLKDGLDIDGVEDALSDINTTITNLAIK